MFKKIDHIAIAVGDLESAIGFFEENYGLPAKSKDIVGDTKAVLIPIGNTLIGLVQSVTPDGTIAKYIEKNGEGMHLMYLMRLMQGISA